MTDIAETADAVAKSSWPGRVALIRTVPERFGTAQQADVYASIATLVYAPHLTPDFAYVHWRDQYELPLIERAYNTAHDATDGFTTVNVDSLAATILDNPATLRIFRLFLGLTASEFAAATKIIATRDHLPPVSASRVKSMEEGSAANPTIARTCAAMIDAAMTKTLFPSGTPKVRSKLDKPDTAAGWNSVVRYARDGVPLAVYLHQRHYGGAFRQLLDATSSQRGDVLEDAVEELFLARGIPFLRTGSDNQEEISRRFGLTVKPAPDFALHDSGGTLRAILECKSANDGGTARDKASRFRSLRMEAARLGGIPVFAVLSGLGWKRARDALGPVVRDTDGRVFTLANLEEMTTINPLPYLIGETSE
ncbi:MAG: hypothetical protein ACKVOI_08625 [Dongiaceae bacterium]